MQGTLAKKVPTCLEHWHSSLDASWAVSLTNTTQYLETVVCLASPAETQLPQTGALLFASAGVLSPPAAAAAAAAAAEHLCWS